MSGSRRTPHSSFCYPDDATPQSWVCSLRRKAVCGIDFIMILNIALDKRSARFMLMAATAAVCALLGALALQQAINGILIDERVAVPREWLTAGLRYAPNSARLLARLAETELAEDDVDLASCAARARRAANLSPWDYQNQLLLASVEEAKGDRAAAEQYLRAA